MNQTRTEITVGIFVVVGIVCLGYLAVRLGKVELFGNKGYRVYADFASVAGLKIGDPVEIAGVKIGKVETLSLAEDKARVGLTVDDSVKLQEDAIASVRSRGLIGDKFILITLGASDKVLQPGGRIRETESPPDLPDLLGKLVGGELISGGEKK
ncbi:MAG: MCE family protein [Deltaproteobacteria bacterium]|nr:MCE family protein [Deltaproteobacteria bacterium]